MEFENQEICHIFRHELRTIPPLLRIPLELHFMHEMPAETIAERLGLSEAG